jgi:hypothetical protein
MRLRLQIERDDGSISKILWGLKNGHKAENMTIAEFLEEIDKAVGIYSYGRDLSRFGVAVDGYECLGHLDVGKLLRDGDMVTCVCLPLLPTQVTSFGMVIALTPLLLMLLCQY